MSKSMPPEERREWAKKLGVQDASLYQALTGKGYGFKPAEVVRIERESNFTFRRWDLRPKDWHLIWPELIGAEGAPAVPEPNPAPTSDHPPSGAASGGSA